MTIICRRCLFVFLSLFVFACSKEEDNTPTKPKPNVTPDCYERDTSFTDQLPNMNFESWGYPDSSEGKYQEPCGGVWASSNPVSVSFTGAKSSMPSGSAQQGDYGVEIKTNSLLGPVIMPGILFTGRYKSYNFSGLDVQKNAEFGVPFTFKPKNIEGFFKYSSVNSDSAYALVLLTKYNTSLKTKDTIGFGDFTILNSVNSYTSFSISIDYSYSSGAETPDSILLLFASSKGALDLVGQPGSTLTVDNCVFVY